MVSQIATGWPLGEMSGSLRTNGQKEYCCFHLDHPESDPNRPLLEIITMDKLVLQEQDSA